ncbi:Ubiquinone biosynthesis O-methyltransferase [BD1-7 clade bacterium]|uniref:Ubiquinone biosynthesis O-methyltransferase n=1 Tax=BD1-7 clade bacterium TaxID=2029982 RepID=A0A5S9QVR3_9GAMM|nr:Ubiquinone biosynthesis O-methyltransferase [BD1-7 clade bacterium]CAA0122536.1 Ubiquinone biosynthesis O-methyltransferase [BD1-7 clade bacterium]
MAESPGCPLCRSDDIDHYFTDKRREYLQCTHCRLVFVSERFHLSAKNEKAEYDKHENDVLDNGYRQFLSRALIPTLSMACAGNNHADVRGLDFGCGPGPALAAMLSEAGVSCATYDIFYQPDRSVFSCKFDFITATEVIEHLVNPGEEIQRLYALLKPDGFLMLMSKLVIDRDAFSRWHYKNDPTHIAFFSRETLAWLAGSLNAELTFHSADVFSLKRK